jgi:chromosome segregation ATPase
MADQDKFRFHLGNDEPEAPAVDEALQRRVHKLGQRLSFLTLVLPSMLAVVVFLAYREIDLRIAQTQTSDTRAAERVAADVELKTGDLRERLAELEASVNARVQGLQTGVDAMQPLLRKAEAAVEALQAAKADKTELGEAATRIDAALAATGKSLQELSTTVQAVNKDLQALAPFREELGNAAAVRAELGRLAARLQNLENSLGKDLTGVAGFVERSRTELAQIKADLAKVQAERSDRNYVDLEILKAKKINQTALEQEMSRIEKLLNGQQRRIDQLERAFSTPAGRTSPPPAPGAIREQPLQ